MSLKDILNTDMTSLGAWARGRVSWWVEELAGMVPANWRPRSARPSLVAQPNPDGSFRLHKDGVPIAAAPGESRVDLVLPQGAVLAREIDLPLLSPKDTQHLVALDIERLSPMRAEAIFFDTEVIARDETRRPRPCCSASSTATPPSRRWRTRAWPASSRRPWASPRPAAISAISTSCRRFATPPGCAPRAGG